MANANVVMFVADMRQAGAEASLAQAARRALKMRLRPSVVLASRDPGPSRTLHLGDGLRLQSVPWSPAQRESLVASLEAVMRSRSFVTSVQKLPDCGGSLAEAACDTFWTKAQEAAVQRSPDPIALMEAELAATRASLKRTEDAFSALKRSLGVETDGGASSDDDAPARRVRLAHGAAEAAGQAAKHLPRFGQVRASADVASADVAGAAWPGGAHGGFGGGVPAGVFGAPPTGPTGGRMPNPPREHFPEPRCPACDMPHPHGPDSAAACSGPPWVEACFQMR